MKYYLKNYFLVLFFVFSFISVQAGFENKQIEKKEFQFQGVPLIIEEISDLNGLKIHVYDPADSVLAPQGFPFIEIEVYFEYNLEGNGVNVRHTELTQLGRTDSLSGAQLIELAKYLQIEYGISKLEVIDVATTLMCPMQGIFCDNAALHPLSGIYVYLFGKSFYEKWGARSIEKEGNGKIYQAGADFLFRELRVDQFVKDLEAIQSMVPHAGIFAEFIKRAVIATDSSEMDLISQVFSRVRIESNRDETSHRLWHEMMDHFIGMKECFLLEFFDYVVTHPQIYPESIREFCALSILNHIQYFIYFDGFAKGLDFDTEAERIAYFLNHEQEVYENILTVFQNSVDADDEEESESILSLTYKGRLNKEAAKNTFLMKVVHVPNLSELYHHALSYLDSVKKSENKEDQKERSYGDGMEDLSVDAAMPLVLMEIFKQSSLEEYPGYIYLKWLAAKEVINIFNVFEFIHPNEVEIENAA